MGVGVRTRASSADAGVGAATRSSHLFLTLARIVGLAPVQTTQVKQTRPDLKTKSASENRSTVSECERKERRVK